MPRARRGQLTVIAPIRPAMVGKLREDLESLSRQLESCNGRPADCPICAMPRLHFLRWVVLPERVVDPEGRLVPESLVLWSVFDGDPDDHLRRLCGGPLAAEIDRLYAHCIEYEGASRDARAAYLRRHTVRTAFFDGLPGWTRDTIEQEHRLSEYLADFLDDGIWDDRDPVHIYLEARASVRANPNLGSLLDETVQRVTTAGPRRRSWLKKLFYGTWDLVLRGVLGGRETPAQQPAKTATKRRAVEQQLTLKSDEIAEDDLGSGVNRGSILSDIRDDWRRALIARLTVSFLRWVALPGLREGFLEGIGTIHCAQWVLVDRGCRRSGRRPGRLAFFTNYDGPWDDYFNDFSTKAGDGVNAIWGTSLGFPCTYGLYVGGAMYPDEFRAAARMHQVHTHVWHSPLDRTLTLERIRNNARIRDGLAGHPSPEQVDAWLRLFERCCV